MHIIGGRFKKAKLLVPSHARPTLSIVRESVFNTCQTWIEGTTVLDLFAGSGAMGFEALSRGALHITFVEKHRRSIEALRKNMAHLGVEQDCTLINSDVLKALDKLSTPFNFIYADPPYGTPITLKLLQLLDNKPLLKPNGALFIEDDQKEVGEKKWSHLHLVRAKKMGRSYLWHYEYRTDSWVI